ncbi:hypothetical protein [uncultured Methanobrevibacter sp.]|uniref:hypothetical protein n=1 Tax=uncultured Methanobrevibacter sp. TaxID=253161 RepID=UPI0025D323AE|nr:hypothetical protein [uncultured Methanobrevibacter sp.]
MLIMTTTIRITTRILFMMVMIVIMVICTVRTAANAYVNILIVVYFLSMVIYT